MVQIRNNDTGASILTMAPANRSGNTEEPKLVFHKYGDRYFLSELWLAGAGAVDCVSMGKLEREVSKAPAAITTVAMRQAHRLSMHKAHRQESGRGLRVPSAF
jgi:hypothetical protein